MMLVGGVNGTGAALAYRRDVVNTTSITVLIPESNITSITKSTNTDNNSTYVGFIGNNSTFGSNSTFGNATNDLFTTFGSKLDDVVEVSSIIVQNTVIITEKDTATNVTTITNITETVEWVHNISFPSPGTKNGQFGYAVDITDTFAAIGADQNRKFLSLFPDRSH